MSGLEVGQVGRGPWSVGQPIWVGGPGQVRSRKPWWVVGKLK